METKIVLVLRVRVLLGQSLATLDAGAYSTGSDGPLACP